MRIKRAFTLVELLTVIAIIGILASLILSATIAGREKARRITCVNNLRQMMLGALMYAQDDDGGNLSSAIHDTNDVFTFFHPGYVKSLNTYLCPSAENFIRKDFLIKNPFTGAEELYDLTGYAGSITNAGTSYELFGFMNHTPDTPNFSNIKVGREIVKVAGVKKTLSSIQNYQHMYNQFNLKGVMPGPARIWLTMDGDEPPGGQNYPDANNNHGAAGGNVGFTDGHAEWVRRKDYVYSYELSQDENRLPEPGRK